jgi:hypothetical protein
MRDLLIGLTLLFAAPRAAGAQGGGSILPADADPGDRLTVTTASGERLTGKLVTDGNGALVLLSNRQNQTVAHADVERVTRHHNRFLFGPLFGLAAGLAAGLPLRSRLENEGRDGDVFLAWTVGIGVGLGSLIDLTNGSDRTVYARKPGVVSGLQVTPVRRGAEARWAFAW